ncbi:MAG: type II secretion system F family protein [Magnetococcus sp. THC-1_WYH]
MAVKKSEILIFTSQFASMLRSQMPLVSILDNLAHDTPGKELSAAIYDVAENVRHGVDFSDSLEDYSPQLFDEIFVNVTRAGMNSGRLPEALTQISEYLTKADAIGNKVRSAVAYPMFMLAAFFTVFNLMVFFILPRFDNLFKSFKKELPIPTQILLAIGNFWRDNWFVILTVMGIAMAAWIWWITNQYGRLIWDEFKLKIPLLGRLWRLTAMARFLRTFAVQLHNEVRLLEALELAASVTGNRYIEEVLYQITNDVATGISITQSFEEYEIFHGIVLQMVATGEETGALDELLISAADYFERILDNQVQIITGLINPILTVVIGIAIAGMMVASFLPVFDMGNVVK